MNSIILPVESACVCPSFFGLIGKYIFLDLFVCQPLQELFVRSSVLI